MSKKTAAKRQPIKEERPEQSDSIEFIDAGTLESGIYEPDDDVADEFKDAQHNLSGRQLVRRKYQQAARPDSPIVGGLDPDANWEEADTVGDESVVGGNPSPEMDNTELIGKAVGLEYQDNEPLHTTDKVIGRDIDRWELDPASSEDYQERMRNLKK